MSKKSGFSRRSILQTSAAAAAVSSVPAWMRSALAQSATTIPIGFLLPLTGSFAEAGGLHRDAVEMAVEEINQSGGIQSMGGARIQALFGNSSTVDEANTETQRMLSGGVAAIVGAYSSGATISATVIAERAGVPFLVPNALADEITQRGLRYVFKTVPHFSQFAINSGEMVTDFASMAGTPVETCCLVRENNFFGNVVATEFTNHIPGFGIDIIRDNVFPTNPTSFEEIILQLRSDAPDVVFAAGEPSSITLLFQQLRELRFWPKLGWVGVGGGYSNPVTWNNLGALADGLLVVNDWFPQIQRPGAAEINERFKQRTGVDMLGNANTTYAGVHVLRAALEQAGSTDGETLRDAFANLDITEGVPMFMYERVRFDDTGFMRHAQLVGAQVRDGQAQVVWPDTLKVADVTWPIPDWLSR